MAEGRAAEAALVTQLLTRLAAAADAYESGSGNRVIRDAIKGTKVSGSSEEELATVAKLRAEGLNGSAIWLSEGVMTKLGEQLYVALCEEIGPVDADQVLISTLDGIEADPAVTGSARKWF